MFSKYNILIRGGGDIATAIAHKLFTVGFNIIITELEKPLMIRRAVSFGNAMYEKRFTVEGVEAVHVKEIQDIQYHLNKRKVVVCHISEKLLLKYFNPLSFIDATISKVPDMAMNYANKVIGIGPGYEAGVNAHVVVESHRGHNLGRVYYKGKAENNTGVPGNINGHTRHRVLRAKIDGVIKNYYNIGDLVISGDIISEVGKIEVTAEMSGVLRGLIHEGSLVKRNSKIADIDPRCVKEYCFTISDKGRTIAGGVLEALILLVYN